MTTAGMRVAVLLSAVVAVAVAQADTYTVNSTTDAVDATPGDGLCATAATTCTVRAAVQEANAHAGPDVITLPAGTYALSLDGPYEDAGATGDLDVHDELQVNGAGAGTTIIDGLSSDRVFHVVSAFAIRDVTIRGGSSVAEKDDNGNTLVESIGGGVFVENVAGGCTVERVTFRNNSADTGGGLAHRLSGPLTITGSTFDGNTETATNGFGLLDPGGGALSVESAAGSGPGVTITDSTFTGNGVSGGLYPTAKLSFPGPLNVTNTTFTNNGNGGPDVLAGISALNVQSDSQITLSGCTFDGNLSMFPALSILTTGPVSIIDTALTNNESTAGSCGGGAVGSDDTVTVSGCDVSDNVGAACGGLVVQGKNGVTIDGTTFRGNKGGTSGGGLVAYAPAGALSIRGTTIAQNRAIGPAGGSVSAATTFTIANSTISGNTALGAAGGGLSVAGSGTIRNVTFVDNDAPTGSAIQNDAGTVTVVSSIIAGSAANHCGGTALTSGGNNLDSNGSCAFAAPGDQNDVDPQLGPLADNGGPTLTRSPLPGSPVIDHGAAADCPATDQRGETRPTDGDGDGTAVCDIGAVEAPTDLCPNDPAKLEPGFCGCGIADDAAMANGTPDCFVNGELRARIARAKAIIGALSGDQDPTEAELNEIGASLKPYLTQFDGQVVLSGKKKKVLKLAKSASKAIAKVTKAKAGRKLEKAKKTATTALGKLEATIPPQA